MANVSDRAQTTDVAPNIPTPLRMSQVIAWLMYAWTTFGVMMLSLRVFLLAAGADLDNSFARFVMNVSADYLQPFRGIFSPTQLGDTGYLDVSAIFAAIVYLFIGWGFHALINYIQHKIDSTIYAQQQERLMRANTTNSDIVVTKTTREHRQS